MKSASRLPILSTSAAGLIPALKPVVRPSRRFVSSSVGALAALLGLSVAPHAFSQTYSWNGSVDNNWSTQNNWTPSATAPPGVLTNVIFGAVPTANTNVNNDYFNTYNSITFNAGGSPFVLSGDSTSIDAGGITNNSTSLQTLTFSTAGGIFLTDNNGETQTWNAASGNILVTSSVGFNGLNAPMTLIITGAHNITITGVISDQAGFFGGNTVIKDGTGILTLTAQNTYLGNTIVNGGTLLVDGSIASTQTVVNAGGTLGGRGLIGGNLLNSGNVSPGDSPTDSSSTLGVKGTYTQTGAGRLTINVSGNHSNVLAVQGHANLGGGLRLVQIGSAPRLKVGQQVTFLTATSGVSGKFSDVSNPLFNTGTIVNDEVVYQSNKVSLEAVQGSFAAIPGLTPNEHAVAVGLNQVAFHNQQPKLISYLDSQPLSKLPADLDRISPDQLSSIFTIGVSLANVQTLNLQRRTDDIRNGSSGFSASGFQTAGSGPLYSGGWGVAGPSGDDGKESKDMKTVAPEDNRWGVFITGIGEWVNVNGDGNGRGYDVSTGGFTLGADYKVTPNFAVGIDAGYAGTASDLSDHGRVYVNGGKLGLYSTYFTGGFYIDNAVNGGYNSYDTLRDGLQGSARGNTDGGELNVLFGTGYDWKFGALSIGPTASFQYTYLGIGSFNETGSLAPLSFRSQDQDSLRTAFGFKTSYDWKIGGLVIKPELRAAWQHEYGDSGYAVDSSFSGGSGSLFTVNGPNIGRDSLLLGAGFAIMWNERTSTYVYYDGDLARTHYDSQNVSAGIRLSF